MRTWPATALLLLGVSIAPVANALDLGGSNGTGQVFNGAPGCPAPLGCAFAGVFESHWIHVDPATGDAFVCVTLVAMGVQFDPVNLNGGFAFQTLCVLSALLTSGDASINAHGFDAEGASAGGLNFAGGNQFLVAHLGPGGLVFSLNVIERAGETEESSANVSASSGLAVGTNCLNGNADVVWIGVTATPPCL